MKNNLKYINNTFFVFTTIVAACTFLYSICSQYKNFGTILSILYGLSCFYFFDFIKAEREKEIQNIIKNIEEKNKEN